MEEIKDKENVQIKVQFEYLNDNNILDLSKEYKINISLLENTNFETNKEKIIANSNFKSENERGSYHMFNKSNKKFFTKNSDFIPFIKTNTTIILINCYTYAGEIIEKIKEELKLINMTLDITLQTFEIKKKEMELTLSCLENNLQVDIFAEEFIYENGIEYLVLIIKNNNGNIRKYAIESINKLLSFQDTYDFLNKNKNLLLILYDVFIGNNEKECIYLLFDIIVKLIGGNEEKTMNLIEKIDENFYSKIIKYLSEDNTEDKIKSHTLLFINMILNFSSPSKHLDLMFNLTNAKIFENLEIIVKYKEKSFLEQLNLFVKTVQKILNESDKNNENYKNINDKFNIFFENKNIYHIQNLIKATKDENQKNKKDAIDELNSLLKDKTYMNILYELFMKNENKDIFNLYSDYIIMYINSDEEKTMNFINSAKYYAEKTHTKVFEQITNYLSEENKDEIKNHSLLFINKILSFSSESKQLEILSDFIEAGILDLLFKLSKNKEKDFLEQLNQFQNIAELIFEKSNQKENYEIIKKKYDLYVENTIYNEIKDETLKIYNIFGNKPKKNLGILVNYIKEKKGFKILYNVFMDNDNINLIFIYFDILVRIFGDNEDKIMHLIDIAQKYAEKNNSQIFNKIINYTSKDNTNIFLKGYSMQIINMILLFSKIDKQYELLSNFMEQGIFENMNDLIKSKDGPIMAQMKIFLNSVKQILKNGNKKDKNYNTIKNKFDILEENKNFYDKTLNEFVVVNDDEF